MSTLSRITASLKGHSDFSWVSMYVRHHWKKKKQKKKKQKKTYLSGPYAVEGYPLLSDRLKNTLSGTIVFRMIVKNIPFVTMSPVYRQFLSDLSNSTLTEKVPFHSDFRTHMLTQYRVPSCPLGSNLTSPFLIYCRLVDYVVLLAFIVICYAI